MSTARRIFASDRRRDVRRRRPWAGLVLLLALALVAAACADDADVGEADPDAEAAPADGWPDDDLRWVIPAAPGGGFDGAARNLQGPWQERLGINLTVDNQEGGNFAIGTQVVHNEGDDCNTVLFHAVPHILFSYLAGDQDVDYTYDDFYPVGAVQIQPAVIMVADDSPYETFDDLIDAARENPGEVSASVSGLANNNYLGLLQLEELLGVDFNIVGYDGGGPARNAVVAGEVDFTHAAAFAALAVADETRVLAIHQEENEWPDISDDAPTLNELTGEDFGNNQSFYGTFVTRACYEEHPERYDVLVETFQDSLQDESYQAQLDELGELSGLLDIGPDEYHEMILEDLADVERAVAERDEL
jgi:tripartite-type tricarboxylate transporter receptor subunit TctC